MNIFGTFFSDVLIGTNNTDFIYAWSGDDYLDGGTGDDYLNGGDGNDLLLGYFGNDILDGGAGDDALYGEGDNDLLFGSFGNDLLDGGSGFDVADYSGLGTAITLEAAGVVNKGGAGTDQLNDIETIIGAAGFANTIDSSTGNSGVTWLDVNLAANSLIVNNVPFLGSLSFEVINFVNVTGTTQGDVIVGNNLDNVLDGWGGDDFVDGGGGNDLIYGWFGDDSLGGGDGADVLYGEAGNDFLAGGWGNDFLDGGSGSDTLNGEAGDDVLNGYGFTVGEYDVFSGGAGADLFVLGDAFGAFYQGLGYATITDFNWTEGDKIQVFGNISDYSLSTFAGGVDIFYQGDLVAYVSNTTDVIPAFDFVTV